VAIVLLTEIEQQVRQLPYDQQLLLIERLIAGLRKESRSEAMSSQLHAMASDPEIRRQLDEIDAEFASAESDGLK
jgi:hypothetical protein